MLEGGQGIALVAHLGVEQSDPEAGVRCVGPKRRVVAALPKELAIVAEDVAD